jgi:O-antigen/teichoic acid export membrane protein
MNKVYLPTFLALAARGAWKEYARIARAITLTVGAATVMGIGFEVLSVETMLHLLFGNRFAGAEPLIVILSVPFFFVAGLHIWLWPFLVSQRSIAEFAWYSFIAIAVGQYGAAFTLYFNLSREVIWFGLGYVLSYGLLYSMMVFRFRGAQLLSWRGVPAE